jgi:hypothetical protein
MNCLAALLIGLGFLQVMRPIIFFTGDHLKCVLLDSAFCTAGFVKNHM